MADNNRNNNLSGYQVDLIRLLGVEAAQLRAFERFTREFKARAIQAALQTLVQSGLANDPDAVQASETRTVETLHAYGQRFVAIIEHKVAVTDILFTLIGAEEVTVMDMVELNDA